MTNQVQGADNAQGSTSLAKPIVDQVVVRIKGAAADGGELKVTKKLLMDTICKGKNISDGDMMQFLTLCQVNQLNPFTREAYLVTFSGTPSQMIVSKEAFFKRADACPNYEGIESGIIAVDGEGNLQDYEGAFLPPKWTLVGGWAKVYRSGRRPSVQRVSLSEYSKGTATWKSMPCTMIRKVAEVQALREAFPSNLNGMYIADEMGKEVKEAVYEEIKEEASVKVAQGKTKVAVNLPNEGNGASSQPSNSQSGTIAPPSENNAAEGANRGSAPSADAPGF